MNDLSDKRVGNEEITLKELILKTHRWVKYLLSRWVILLIALITGLIAGYIYSRNKKPVYRAECTFVVEDGAASSAQISGLASLIGLDMTGGNTGILFQGEGLLSLYTSRLMIEKTLFSTIHINDTTERLIDRYVRINNIAKNWNEVSVKDQIKSIAGIVQNISKNYMKIKSEALVKVSVTSSDEVFSKEFTEKVVENVNSFYIETKVKKSQEAVEVLQKQADSVKRVLNSSISGIAASIDANPNANAALQILKVPSQKRQVDVQAASAIYTEVMKNLEATKMTLRRETPLIQIVDRPFYPLDNGALTKPMAMAISGFIFVFISVTCLTLILLYKKIIS